jgi:hypothetical protein
VTSTLRPPRVALTAAAALLAAGLLSACGGGNPDAVVVTVTAGSGSGSPSAPDASPDGQPDQKLVPSDVKGRKFDFGVVTKVDDVNGTPVLVFDRWTDPKVDDKVLAQEGIAVRTYDKAKNPYRNVNTKVTFRIPVHEGVTFLLHHCTNKDEPLQSKSVTAQELADAPAEDKLVLLEIDSDGYTTGGETFAGC